MDKRELTNFLLKARTKTYAGGGGKVKPVFTGLDQLEYSEGDWLYRDVYYTGNGIFTGLEVVHYQDKPVWAMSYYGNFKKMKEEELDSILRQALLDNWEKARTWKKVEWSKGDYKYICEPDKAEDLEREEFTGSIEEMAGMEKIFKHDKDIYTFVYAGGLIKDL